MFDKIKKFFSQNNNGYKGHNEAIIISCFFNPQNSPYRIKAFNIWYDSIKHLNHKIIECVIGDSKPQLKESENIERIYTESLLWHKETLLNKIISELPKKYKYVFWIDADVIFTNKNWLVEGVEQMKNGCTIIQPFEYCVHLDKDELKPSFDIEQRRIDCSGIYVRHKQMWRGFCANYVKYPTYANSENYDVHGHVGFAWGATRELLDEVPLYDKALIGGGDHIIAHAAAGQIGHVCITKSFTDDIDDVLNWSRLFYAYAKGKIGYVKGDLFHIWHGDIDKRDYFNRIVNFTSKAKEINIRDKNGMYVSKDKESIKYMNNYFKQREVDYREIHKNDDRFWESFMYGYLFNDGTMGGVMGGNFAGGMMGDMMNDSDNQKNIIHDHNHDNNNNNDVNINNSVNDSINVNNEDNHNHSHDHNGNNDYQGSTFS